MTYRPLWAYDLQPASWRGIPFFIDAIKINTGRRVAVHEYPYRDLPWVEDLGKAVQEISVQAFVLGDDVAAQYKRLKDGCEQGGSGELVHPRIGSLLVSLVSSAFTESKEASNVVTAGLVFVVTQNESSTTLWPISRSTTTGKSLGDAVLGAASGSQGDFFSRAAAAVRSGQAAVNGVVTEARGYVSSVQTVISDATRAANTVAGIGRQLGIKGLDFSRYLAPLNRVSSTLTSVNSGLSSITRVSNTVTSLTASANAARGTVERVADRVTTLVNKI